MRTTLFLISLFVSSSALAKPFIYAGYGLGNYSDEKKSDVDLKLKTTPMKIGIGQRFGHLEFEMNYRMAGGESEFIHDSVKNKIIHKSSAVMAGIGIYTVPFLRLHGGVAFQNVKEELDTEVTDIQREDIDNKYNLTSGSSLGTYFGLDFHVMTLWIAKLTISGTVYYTSSFARAKEYEGMIGFKIPFGGGGRSSSFSPLKSMSER